MNSLGNRVYAEETLASNVKPLFEKAGVALDALGETQLKIYERSIDTNIAELRLQRNPLQKAITMGGRLIQAVHMNLGGSASNVDASSQSPPKVDQQK